MHRPLDTDNEWNRFSSNLAACLAALDDDDVLILEYKHANYYVQVWDHGHFGVRAEAASNAFIEPPTARLTVEQYERLDALGWQRATLAVATVTADDDRNDKPRLGSPNFYMDIPAPVDSADLAHLATRTFREVYRVGHPTWLQYHAFAYRGRLIRLPTLRIKQRHAR